MPQPTTPMEWMSQFMEKNPMPKVLGGSAEELIKAQDDVVADFHDYVEHWCERRHEGTKAALECARKLSNGSDLSDSAKVLSSWVSGVAHRLGEDTREQVELSRKFFSHFAIGAKMTSFPFGEEAREAAPAPAKKKNGSTAKPK